MPLSKPWGCGSRRVAVREALAPVAVPVEFVAVVIEPPAVAVPVNSSTSINTNALLPQPHGFERLCGIVEHRGARDLAATDRDH